MADRCPNRLGRPTGILILLIFWCLVNACQYAFGLGSESSDGWAVTYGIPFAYYEYVNTLSRGRVLYLGVFGNLFFAMVLGILLSRLLPGKRD